MKSVSIIRTIIITTPSGLELKVTAQFQNNEVAPWDTTNNGIGHMKEKYEIKIYQVDEKEAFISCPFWTPEIKETEAVCFSALQCIVGDATCYANAPEVENFLEELGYLQGDAKTVKAGLKAFKGCEKTYKAFYESGISEDELFELANFISDIENGDAEEPTEY